MSFFNTYSMRAVLIEYATLDLTDGKPEDGFLTVTQNAPRATFRKGGNGNTSVSLSADHSVRVTLSLFPESPAAIKLRNFYSGLKLAERTENPILAALPLVISDPSGAYGMIALEAALESVGDVGLGADTGTLDFVFYVEDAYESKLAGELGEEVSKALSSIGIDLDNLI